MPDAETYTSVLEHFARYHDACDRADFDAVLDQLAGATVRFGGLETDDAAVVRRAYETAQPAPHPDGRRRTKHHLTNLILTADGDAIVASAYYLRLGAGSDGRELLTSGRLEQVLIRDGAAWRVCRHTVTTDF